MSNILNQSGKGSAPRNNFSKNFRSEHDRIFGPRETRFCPHGIRIGDDCPECLAALPIERLVAGTGINKITKILPKKKS